jgi:hypothetical protein
MALAEQEARKADKTHIFLWTWSFQAPEFYRSKGHDKIQIVKRLA